MTRSAAFAPHLGAALAATLLVCTGTAFRAGAEGVAFDAGQVAAEARAHLQGAFAAEARENELPQITATESSRDASRQIDAPVRPRLAVIIDDVGMDRAAAARLLALDVPLTVSILPYAETAPQIAEAALARGHEVFLHLPMEPVGLDDPGPLALTGHLSPDDLAARARWALTRVPGAAGFNNHMGSRLTADAAAMDAVFAPLQRSGLVFVDSMTSPDSVAGERAAAAGLAALQRDVFLDHERSPQAVEAAIEKALAVAVERGQAIAIGHPHAVTLEALGRLRARAEAAGVDLVPVSALVARRDPV